MTKHTHTHVGNILITYIIDKVMCYKEEIKKHPDVESGWGGRGCVHERSFQQSIKAEPWMTGIE